MVHQKTISGMFFKRLSIRILLYVCCFIFISCDKNEEPDSHYPIGMIKLSSNENNDCSLPECSLDRTPRFIAKNVEGKIYESNSGGFLLFYPFTFDSYVTFHFCDLPLEFQKQGLEIIFDGMVVDACGVYQPVWPEEETYILRLDKIRLL